jgi:hypothetical protein
MTALLAQAEQMIRTATAGRGIETDAATRWYQILQQAKGEEAEQIAYMGEALLVSAQGVLERAWVEGLLRGGPKEAKARARRLAMTQQAEQQDARRDAAESAAKGGIDWSKVGREAQVMVDLNLQAMVGWEGSPEGE